MATQGAEQAAPGGVGPNGPTVGDARIGDTLPDNDVAKREHELAFEGALKEYVEKHAKNIRLLTKEQHDSRIECLLHFDAKKRTPQEYMWRKTLTVLSVGGKQSLYYAKSTQDLTVPVANLPRLVHDEELFEVLHTGVQCVMVQG